jgi:nucleotide-binding universal stress UspA family protein
VTEGDPRQVIVHFAKKTGLPVDMIIMGATGKGSMERLLIGSTTTYVVNHADCNVLVVR